MSKIKWSSRLSNIHKQLRTSNFQLNELVKQQDLPKSQSDEQEDPKPNSLTVNIEFTFATKSKHGTFSESLPVSVPSHKLLSMSNSHMNKDHKPIAVEHVQERHNHGFQWQIHKQATQKNGPKHYENTPTYQTAFHHSEQAFYSYITERSNLDTIITKLKERGLKDGTKITNIQIDMHSIRYMCGNCEIGGLGLMNHKYHFLEMITKALNEQNLKVSKNLKHSIHVSAEKPHKTTPLKKEADHKAIDTHDTILSSDAIICKIPFSQDSDIHNRTIFISSDPSQGIGPKYLTAIDELERQEYSNMILKGKTFKTHAQIKRELIHDKEIFYKSYSNKDLNQMELAFLDLSLLDSQTRSYDEMASKLKQTRDSIKRDIAYDQSKFDKIKTDLLAYKINSTDVSKLSLNTLKNFSSLIDSKTLTIREIYKYMQKDKKFADVIASFSKEELGAMSIIGYEYFVTIYTKDPVNFINFINEALKLEFDLSENLELNFALYSYDNSIERLTKLYDFVTGNKIARMYDAFGNNVLKLSNNNKTLKAFSDDSVINYLSDLYDEDNDRLDFHDLLDAHEENENMFWDIIIDYTGKNLGHERIQSAYRAKHSHHNDSEIGDDEDDDQSTISDSDIYDNLVAEDEEDFGYDYRGYDSDYESELNGEYDF